MICKGKVMDWQKLWHAGLDQGLGTPERVRCMPVFPEAKQGSWVDW